MTFSEKIDFLSENYAIDLKALSVELYSAPVHLHENGELIALKCHTDEIELNEGDRGDLFSFIFIVFPLVPDNKETPDYAARLLCAALNRCAGYQVCDHIFRAIKKYFEEKVEKK